MGREGIENYRRASRSSEQVEGALRSAWRNVCHLASGLVGLGRLTTDAEALFKIDFVKNFEQFTLQH